MMSFIVDLYMFRDIYFLLCQILSMLSITIDERLKYQNLYFVVGAIYLTLCALKKNIRTNI